jgi:enoyl-CoA hydratase/carnithine racemase
MADFEIIDHGQILELRLNRPESRNSLTFEMYQAVQSLCAEVDPITHCALVLTAEGEKAFASGTDISNFKTFSSPQDAIDYEAMIGRVVDAVASCAVPVIASLHGVVAGGGAAIAAASDLRIATPTTRFGMPIARTLGNCLSIANLRRLTEMLGESRVRYLMLTAQFVECDVLTQSGFVSEVIDGVAACDDRARALALGMADLAPRTLQATRIGLARLHEAALPDDQDLIESCYMSADFQEGVAAFFEKRKAVWRGM